MAKTIIVSNRLPVKITQSEDGLSLEPSPGGLATGLGSVYKEGDNIWIGWPGLYLDEEEVKTGVAKELRQENMSPVWLSEAEIKDYYEGFSNETLWPTFHYFPQYVEFESSYWDAYLQVNRKFADAIMALAEDDDTIWVHDYQLLLVPEMLREKLPNASIGFFQHIPFPSYEIFRMIPWRRELLNGMLGADLIGFHTYDDMRHFLSAVNRLAGYSNEHGVISTGTRKIKVDSFPMGIDYDKYHEAASSGETLEREVRYRRALGDHKLMLSIDRLDYSKGIPQRLRAFEELLIKYPDYRQKVSLLMVVVPSRDKVGKYKALKDEIELLVGRINGQYGRINWRPIHYFYRSYPLAALSAFYRMSQVALVTPMRDGMNLVCKEYIASKLDQKGVLILSEMAGASKELSDAILVNPNNMDQMVEAMDRALTMPAKEQKQHIRIMQNSLQRYNIHHWVSMFMTNLESIKENQKGQLTRQWEPSLQEKMLEAYNTADKRLLFLDYDGTLVGFTKDPMDAKPTTEVIKRLETLAADPKNKVVIISGRGRDTLEEWLGHLPIDFIVEHGVWMREQGKNWERADKVTDTWKEEMRKILDLYVDRTPGSLVEEKNYSLVWHYRKVETGLGEMRSRELCSHLKFMAANADLQVLEGDMVVEIKNRNVNKGRAAQVWINRFPSDFYMAIGDDWTDEDTFKAMPKGAYTIKVGGKNSAAHFYVESHENVHKILASLEAENSKA